MTNPNQKARIELIDGIDEIVTPEIRLTRSRDGRTGQAIFIFERPKALTIKKAAEIAEMTLIDGEGELRTRDIKARFINGLPSIIEVTYTWKSEVDFERFMRFAQSYAETHGLGYSES